MDSPPTSRIQLCTLDGWPITAPSEWTPALVRAEIGTDRWSEVTLGMNGLNMPLRLQRVGGKITVLADWPRSGPGRYHLELIDGERVEAHTITIKPTKISPNALDSLLEDLHQRLPVAVAMGLARLGGLSGVRHEDLRETSLAEEIVRLRLAILGAADGRIGLASALRMIASEPHRVLETEEVWVRRAYLRRPSAVKLPQAVIKARNLGDDGLPLRAVDARSRHSVDVYENHFLKLFYEQVAMRLRRLVGTNQFSENDPIGNEVNILVKELTRSRRIASFLDEVTLPKVLPTQVTMALMKRTGYRSALERFLEFHRGFQVMLDEDRVEAPLENLPYLYQLWNTLEVLRIMLDWADANGFRVIQQQLVTRRSGTFFVDVVPNGKPVLTISCPTDGRKICVVPERNFGPSGQMRSVSFNQRPDVVIEVHEPNGELWLIILDPKYKLDSEGISEAPGDGTPKKEDIDKMHAYRDAIRDHMGTHLVRFAAILYPGSTCDYGDGLAAIGAVPGAEEVISTYLGSLLESKTTPFRPIKSHLGVV